MDHGDTFGERSGTRATLSPSTPPSDRVVSLRGPEVVSIGRKVWHRLVAVGLALSFVALIVNVVSTAHDNSRIERMKTHGIAVSVSVTRCIGNVGGSGSNGAGYTCQGDYSIAGTAYHELIGSMTTFAVSGTKVNSVADPSKPTTVILASALAKSTASPAAYVPAGLMAIVLIALTFVFVRFARRSGTKLPPTP